MERLTSSAPVPAHLRGAVMALGNFDGFHAGHQAVVGHAIARARAEGRPVIVATFDPHPMRLFRPDTPHFRLTTLDQRQALFAAAGADAMLVFAFTPELAALDPQAFVRLLADDMGVAGVVTGQDFTFGRGRAGSVAVLAELGAASGLWTQAVAPVADASGDIISSTRIRTALQGGDCATATRLLTRPFIIEGVVQHGDKLGRTIGFPTANIDMGDYLRPAYGIYAVRGLLPDGRVLDGAANLGIRPMFDPPKWLLEPHFFDFAEN
ncbi:MAG: riboflavin biosynthesis protein RibF, partial [Alphaproteobacteria bacterium]